MLPCGYSESLKTYTHFFFFLGIRHQRCFKISQLSLFNNIQGFAHLAHAIEMPVIRNASSFVEISESSTRGFLNEKIFMNVPVNTVCVIVSIIFYENMVQIFNVRFKHKG